MSVEDVAVVARNRLPFAWQIIRAMAVTVVRAMAWRVEVRGLEHVPRHSGAVIAFNHHSYFDFVMAAWAIVRRLHRPVRFLAKREIWESRWTGWIVTLAHAVPVDRSSAAARAGAYDAAIDALASGDLVAVAPEQTVSTSFELLPFRTGAVRMAQQAGVPIIPAVGWGSQRFASKGNGVHFTWRLPVVVVYGEPIEVAPDADVRAATADLQAVMTTMLREVQDAYPSPRPGAPNWWQPKRLGGGAPDHDEVLRRHAEREQRWDTRPEDAG
jgi:1-acyl-sn-glycerol-3-phosphate acyltransferase